MLPLALWSGAAFAAGAGQDEGGDASAAEVISRAGEMLRGAAQPAPAATPPAGATYVPETSEIERTRATGAAAIPAAGTNGQGPLPAELTLYGGQVVVHGVDRALRRVAVGSGKLLEVKTLGSRELVIIANEPGNTALHLWFTDGSQRDVPVTIVDDNLGQAARVLQSMLGPASSARVAIVGGNVVVTGQDISQADWYRIEEMRKAYPSIVNLGSVDAVGMRPMVAMDVQIMEFDRNALEELGIRWDSSIDGPNAGALYDSSSSEFRVLPEGSDFDKPEFDGLANPIQTAFGLATSITSRINLLVNKGKAYALASPHLSTRSGGEANFLVGGEVPIPVSSLFGQTQVEFKEYGIKLDISPVVNGSGEILTTLMAEVSRIDPSITVNGIPGFLTRRTRSEANVRDGETIVISGLTDINAAKSADKFPILGEIPILGRLFRSDRFRANQTDLVVFVTPRIVGPDSQQNLDRIEQGRQIRRMYEDDLGRKLDK
ncbi:type II and III secretion system protein family protein [Novilysobacter arseniciresistens]|uniref:type II and III secretion system protein family protein n=1 Tax=Novilysobacter arseniciresistens TaxID=1385522 RepID=UPI00069195C9|nr:pilus assembly protein N-terminal domain-containing protein [Lysobacter arseniciresistens]